jgi:methyl-accepting chemotaxis protein
MDHPHSKKMHYRAMISILILLSVSILSQMFLIARVAKVNDAAQEIAKNWLPSAWSLGNINIYTTDFRRAEVQHILTTNPDEMRKHEEEMDVLSRNIIHHENLYQPLISSPEEQKLYNSFRKQWDDFIVESKIIRKYSQANQNEEARNLVYGESQKHFEELRNTLIALIDLNVNSAIKDGAQSDELFRSTAFYLSLISLLVSLPLIIWLAYRIFVDEY